MNSKIFSIFEMVRLCIFGILVLSLPALANDGRNRYEGSTPSLLEHLSGPVAQGAGFRVLSGDKAGGADGDPAFRWAMPHALALVQVAAWRTEQEFGKGKYAMAVFDCSAENADTPIGFGYRVPGRHGPQIKAPDGRHPGGSHDGGLNLDLGYYLQSLKGKFLDEDYAACTGHYQAGASRENFEAKDMHRCLGPADRLDVPRQAYFVLELLKINRRDFSLGLMDTGGMDAQVQKALLAQFAAWQKEGKYSVNSQLADDLRRLFSHDPWDGWAGYHHHHLHLRLLASSATGALMAPAQDLVRQARDIRARLHFKKYPLDAAYIDANLLSYKLHRSVEMHLMRPPAGKNISAVQYRVDGKKWLSPHEPGDDQRLILDLEPEMNTRGKTVQIEAKVSFSSGDSKVLVTRLFMPRCDPRLYISYHPGSIQGRAKVRKSRLRASLQMPDVLRSLVTSVRYLVYKPAVHTKALCLEVKSGWFTRPADSGAGDSCKQLPRAKDTSFSINHLLPKEYRNTAMIEAKVVFSKRLAETIPLFVEFPPGTGENPPAKGKN